MPDKNKDRFYSYVSAIMVIFAITLWMFKIHDPAMLLLPCLLIVSMGQHNNTKISFIDFFITSICLYDILHWYICPFPGNIYAYTSLICFISYVLIRRLSCKKNIQNFFLKLTLIPIIIALGVTLASFIIFIGSVYQAGFSDTYSFRHLFTPFGYITNAWSSIYLPILGLLTISFYRIPKWRILFGTLWIITSAAMLLSFSRGAFIAWGVYALCILLSVSSWRKKLKFLGICFCISGSIWFLFPSETATTLAMNKKTTQRGSTESRFNTMEKAIDIFKENNRWTGSGNGTFSLALDKMLFQDTTHAFTSYAPNIIIQLMVEKGIVGLTLYIGLGISILIFCIKRKEQMEIWLTAGCLLALLIKEMTMSILLNDAIVGLLIYILIALLQTNDSIEKIPPISSSWKKYTLPLLGGICYIGFLASRPKEIPTLVNRAITAIQNPDSLQTHEQLDNLNMELSNVDTSKDTYLLYIQAKLTLLEGKNEKACLLLQNLARKYPRNASFQYDLSYALYQDGKKEEAAIALSKALWLKPRLLQTNEMKDLFATDSLMKNNVINRLTPQLAEQEKAPDAYARYGYLTYYLIKKEKAYFFLKKALDKQPNLSTPWLLIGNIYKDKGKEKEAKQCFKKYNLLTNGAFSNQKYKSQKEQVYSAYKLLFEEYAKKFPNWYGCKLAL